MFPYCLTTKIYLLAQDYPFIYLFLLVIEEWRKMNLALLQTP